MNARSFYLLMCFIALLASTAHAAGPTVRHRPITAAVQGQSVSIRAQVVPGDHPLKTVTLFFTVSPDASPFKVAMKQVGEDTYSGIIPATFIEADQAFTYYLEAVDQDGYMAETPWHNVRLSPIAVDGPVENGIPAGQSDPSWVKPALIAGGVAAAAGVVAIAVSGSGGGGGGGGGDDPPAPGDDHTGTYVGTAMSCLQNTGATQCDTYSLAIVVQEDGSVITDTLEPGQFMRTALDGRDFNFSVQIDKEGLLGMRHYRGTLVDSRIIGEISGNGTENGLPVTFSGTFNLSRQ